MRIRFQHEGDAVLAGMVMWLVIFLLIFTAVWWAATAQATPIAYDFTGTTGVGTVTGAFHVDLDAPIATNVRGWSNTVYAVSNWQFIATSNLSLLPTTTFHNAGSFEYCVGICTFGGASSTVLTLLDDSAAYRLKLTFTPDLFTRGSWYERINGPVALVQTGTLTSSVPVPDTFWLFLVGMATTLAIHWIARGVPGDGIAIPRSPLVE